MTPDWQRKGGKPNNQSTVRGIKEGPKSVVGKKKPKKTAKTKDQRFENGDKGTIRASSISTYTLL